MSKKGYSREGLFGDIHHYDEKGRKIGTSKQGMFGRYTNYDAKGNKMGYSDQGMFGRYNHYDNRGKKIGHTDQGLFGDYKHYDSRGKTAGRSNKDSFGGYNHYSGSGSQGCYIATAVYGSYNCPQVWTLRRFRDNTLASAWYGRAFIRVYYAVSPTLVRWFGHTKWFNWFWKKRLDKAVHRLNANGVADTPYTDKKR